MIKQLIKKLLRPIARLAILVFSRFVHYSGLEGKLASLEHRSLIIDERLSKFEENLPRLLEEKLHCIRVQIQLRRKKQVALSQVLNLARLMCKQVTHPFARPLELHLNYCADLYMRYSNELYADSIFKYVDNCWSPNYSTKLGDYNFSNESEHPTIGSEEFPLLAMLDDPDCGVFLLLGQPNINIQHHISWVQKSDVYVLNPITMRCHHDRDSLLGVSIMAGSIWSRLGAQLINEGLYRKVLFIPIPFGNQSAQNEAWERMAQQLQLCLARLGNSADGVLPISAVILQQNETDAGQSDQSTKVYAEYIQSIAVLLRKNFVVAPMFVTSSANEVDLRSPEFVSRSHQDLCTAYMPEMGILQALKVNQTDCGHVKDNSQLSMSDMDVGASRWFETIRDARTILLKPRATILFDTQVP